MPPAPRRIEVVTAFVTRGPAVLLLKRSDSVRTYNGHWAAVSGYLEDTDPLRRAWIELEEELGLDEAALALRARGAPLEVDDGDRGSWLVHPFRFELVADREPVLDREHTTFEWAAPDSMARRLTVPGLAEAWRAVAMEKP